ncbi:class F sortase [Microbacterium yannicii]|uniref:class F sortase n=1 Tax=Microbacterium yannicii TaxID=671622 RepID=UPI00030713CE|nr:class F sortase [Microbacterium yannicii]
MAEPTATTDARPSPTENLRPPSPSTPARALEPVAVSIPAIDLAVPLIDLSLTPDGDMEVPADYDEVGWFTGGGRPGGLGPTVIAGHVDSPTGPAVFVHLAELRAGDLVEVTDAAGTVFRYVVTAVADYPKASFPTHEVFGAVAADELRLITCGGIFDRAASSYVDNRVVYAVREAPAGE